MTAKRNKINGLKRQIGSIGGLLSGQSFLVVSRFTIQKLMDDLGIWCILCILALRK